MTKDIRVEFGRYLAVTNSYEWVGEGRFVSGSIVDCAADLPEEVFGAAERGIASGATEGVIITAAGRWSWELVAEEA